METSAINLACSKFKSGTVLKSLLEACGCRPVIGLHAIYEMARCFLVPEGRERGKEVFLIVRDLDPWLLPPTWELLKQEVLKLRTGAAVTPFLDHLNHASTRLEIERLAAGIFDSRAEEFIRSREGAIRTNSPVLSEQYLAHVKRVKNRSVNRLKKIKTFDDIVREVLKKTVSFAEAVELSQRLASFLPFVQLSMPTCIIVSSI